MNVTPDEYDVLLRHDLTTFIERAFRHLDPQTAYQHNWHIDLLADRLRRVADGGLRRLVINVPPRSMKSIAASVAFPAWVLGRDPSKRIICASYGQDLSSKLARDTMAVMTADWYQRAFTTRLAASRFATADFETTQRGGRMATSVGGVLTGRGADLIIIDDPVKPDEALSDAQRKTANDWFDNTVYTRLNDKRTGAIVIIMQRLHLDDLVGHVLEKEAWEVVSLPAIATADEVWDYKTLAGSRRVRRTVGDLLHGEREPVEVLDALRSTLGSYTFDAQYLQSPVPLGGGLVKADWLNYYTPDELPTKFDSVVQSWDTANKESDIADYSVCTTWGIKNRTAFLLDVYRKRMDYPELKRTVSRLADQWKPQRILIEDKASGTQLIQELRQANVAVRGVKCEGPKVMRLMAQTPAIEGGMARFPRQAPWLDAYVHELMTFPQGRHDDQVDSTSQALAYITKEGFTPGIIQYYENELARARGERVE